MAVKNEVDTAVVKACLQILPDTLRQQNFDMGIRLMKALDNGREPLCRNAGVRADDDSARRKPVDFRGKLGKPVLLMQKVADYDKNFSPSAVGRTPFLSRVSRGKPSSFSSAFTSWQTPAGV